VVVSFSMAHHTPKYNDPDEQMLFAWANAKLRHAEAGQIEDVGAGFDNGIMLANLIKAVTGETVTKIAQNPRVLAMKLDNLKKCLERLDDLGVDVRDISPTNINQGDEKLIFGLLYKLLVAFDSQNANNMYEWVQSKVDSQLPGIQIVGGENFKDGLVFAALSNCVVEGSIDIQALDPANKVQNLELAFETIEKVMGIQPALQAINVAEQPDELRVLAYLGLIQNEFNEAVRRTASMRASELEETIAAEELAAAEAAAPAANTTVRSGHGKTAANDKPTSPKTSAKSKSKSPKSKPKPKAAPPMFDAIEVTVKEATNLKNMETFGRMNPYTVIWVNFEPHEKSTEVHSRGGVTPQWNQQLVWRARGMIEKLRMKVIVWDKETFGFDDYVGGGDVNVQNMKKGETVEKWVPITQHTQSAGSVLLRITLK